MRNRSAELRVQIVVQQDGDYSVGKVQFRQCIFQLKALLSDGPALMGAGDWAFQKIGIHAATLVESC
jgi:hypothetical protein